MAEIRGRSCCGIFASDLAPPAFELVLDGLRVDFFIILVDLICHFFGLLCLPVYRLANGLGGFFLGEDNTRD